MKKTSLVILGVTALLCSRALFLFFNDPEGPNLLVVTVMAAIIYLLSLALYVFAPPVLFTGSKRLLPVIFFQILLVVVLYFFLK